MNSSLNVQITVRSRLSDRLAGAFDGMTFVRCGSTTELTGEVVDRTALHGLLTRIRDLGLELVSVRVEDADAGAKH